MIESAAGSFSSNFEKQSKSKVRLGFCGLLPLSQLIHFPGFLFQSTNLTKSHCVILASPRLTIRNRLASISVCPLLPPKYWD